MNLEDKQCKGIHRVLLFIDRIMVAYFDSFGINILINMY